MQAYVWEEIIIGETQAQINSKSDKSMGRRKWTERKRRKPGLPAVFSTLVTWQRKGGMEEVTERVREHISKDSKDLIRKCFSSA